MSVITVEEARAYARDYESDEDEILALIAVAESTIADAAGASFDREDAGAKMLAKLIVADLNDSRQIAGGGRRDLVSGLMLQLRTKTEGATQAGAHGL